MTSEILRWTGELLIAGAVLAVVEALIKPILRNRLRQRIAKLPPEFWARVDEETRQMIADGKSGDELKVRWRELLEELTGECWGDTELGAVSTEFDVARMLDRLKG